MTPTIRAALVAALLVLGGSAGVSSSEAVAPPVVSSNGGTVTVTGTSADEVIDLVVSDGAPSFRAASPNPIQAGPGCSQVSSTMVACNAIHWPTVRLAMGYGDDTVTLNASSNAFLGFQPSGRTFVETGGGSDYVHLPTDYATAVRAEIALGSGNDHAKIDRGNPREINVEGGPGTDLLEGSPVVDYLDGGSGNDSITGGGDDDVLLGDSGNDTINGGTGKDLILGDYGTDRLEGGEGQDSIFGGYGNDTLLGGLGGGDELRGDSGADVITSGNGPGSSLYGGEGIDSLNAQNGAADRIINCGESTSDKAKADPGELTISCEKPLA